MFCSRRGNAPHRRNRGSNLASTENLPAHVIKLVDEIAARFQPERIVLFGSHATGVAGESSDVDLLIVMPTTVPPVRQAVAIYRSLDHQVPADILVRTPEQVEARNPRDLILRAILSEGITVHEAGD